MGFINWNGERDDRKARYEEVKEYAQMVEEEERECAHAERIKNFATNVCGTPELYGLSRESVIKVLMSEFNRLKETYEILIQSKSFSWDYDLYLPFRDLWLYMLSSIVYSDNMNTEDVKNNKIYDLFVGKIFKIEGQIGREQYFENINSMPIYTTYMQQSFELSEHDSIYFWKWIGYLSKNIPIDNMAKDFVDDFYTLLIHLIYFINILSRRFDLGIKYIEKRERIKKNLIAQTNDNSNLNTITEHMVNPTYSRERDIQKAVEYKHIKESKLKQWKEKLEEQSVNAKKTDNSMHSEDSDWIKESTNIRTNNDSYDKIKLDRSRIESLIEQRNLTSFAEIYSILIDSNIPQEMGKICRMLTEEICILRDSIEKYKDIYQLDLDQFYDYYLPESIELISTYIDYLNARVDERIINEAKEKVIDSSEHLLIAIVDMKNELYKFGSMELKARANALESVMGQNGHVSTDQRL